LPSAQTGPRRRFGADRHRAELVDPEPLAIPRDAFLDEEHGPGDDAFTQRASTAINGDTAIRMMVAST
jgi:hypothetical protein